MGASWYDGATLSKNGNPVRPEDFGHACVVIVSGDGINPCGHALLHVGNSWYVHVAGIFHHPRYLSQGLYQHYLTAGGKKEVRRWPVHIPNPQGAYRKLIQLLGERWIFHPTAYNCVVFIEKIVQAGGSDAGMCLNCPQLERFA